MTETAPLPGGPAMVSVKAGGNPDQTLNLGGYNGI